MIEFILDHPVWISLALFLMVFAFIVRHIVWIRSSMFLRMPLFLADLYSDYRRARHVEHKVTLDINVRMQPEAVWVDIYKKACDREKKEVKKE